MERCNEADKGLTAMADIARLLIEWSQEHKKIYPFRWQKDPFKILVAGILLKKTQASRVAPVYQEVMSSYGTPNLLVAVNVETLESLLKPLGIKSRARELVEVSRIIVNEHKGSVPASYNDLIKLPGVGDYIASCVLVLGFDQSFPMVDVNVKRVIVRLFGTDADIHRLYADICPRDTAEEFHYAILDFAHEVCRHSKPKCALCPLKERCKS